MIKQICALLVSASVSWASYYPLPASAVVVGSDTNKQPVAATTTGSGTTVDLQNTPVLTTPNFAIGYGGSAAGSTMELDGTSSGSPSNAYLKLQTNGQFTVMGGSLAPIALFDIQRNTTSLPHSPAPAFRIQGADTELTTAIMDATGNNAFTSLQVNVAAGTAAAPTALTTSNDIFQFKGSGYDGSAFANAVTLRFAPTQTWTTMTHGSRIVFATTAQGSTTATANFIVDHDGQLYAPGLKNITTAASGTICYLTPGTGPVNGTIQYDGSLGCLASSRRFKHSIEPLRLNALRTISRMKPVSFRYNHEPDTPHYGLIAEDVASLDKTLVGYKEGIPYSVRQMDIVTVMIQAIQELTRRNGQLERRLNQLAKDKL
jgi:hypothetical protein